MKKLAKVLSLVLVFVMMLSLGASAWADTWDNTGARPSPKPATPTDTTNGDNYVSGAGDFTVTVVKNSTDKATHTYAAYQIFAGDLLVKTENNTTTRTLSNITWGSGIDTSKLSNLKTALEAIDNSFASITFENTAASAQAVAKAISDLNAAHDDDTAKKLAAAFGAALAASPTKTGGDTQITGLNPGYYLIKDSANVTGEGAQTRFILEVVADVTVYEKASVPSVVKKVKEKNDTTGEVTDWQDAADYDIGDSVPFQITATTASTVGDYVKYHVTIQDKQSAGLDAPEKFTITVLGQTFYMKNDGTFYDSSFSTVKSSGNTATTTKGTKITVSKATAETDQTFAIKVEFENITPVTKIDSEANSKPIVVTYESELNSDAVIGTPGNPNEVYLKFSNNPNSNDGNDEGKTPTDKVIVFTYEIKALKVEPTSDAAIDQEAYEALTAEQKANYVQVGDKWQKTQALSGAGFTLFKKVPTSVDSSGYVAVGSEITGGTTFEFKGTDAGEYKLVETTVPAGYNKAADITITVAATYDTEADDPKLKTLTVTPETAGFTVSTTKIDSDTHITTDGIITGKVMNQKGTVLPSTGGIGTTLFYVLGSLLVIAAGVYFVTKKRMDVE